MCQNINEYTYSLEGNVIYRWVRIKFKILRFFYQFRNVARIWETMWWLVMIALLQLGDREINKKKQKMKADPANELATE